MPEKDYKTYFKRAIEEAIAITDRNIRKWQGKLPDISDAGVYTLKDSISVSKCTSWRIGFGIGIMYLLYDYTKNKKYEETAKAMLETFSNRPISNDQCQGVLHIPSCLSACRYSESKLAAKLALEGADALMSLFTSVPGYFRAFERYENYVVDSAINTVLLHWASLYTNDENYYHAARKQLDNIIKYSIRDDGSTYQMYWFDSSGAPMEGTTTQGHDDASTWSRGQAWAMLGFALHYRFTSDEKYFEAFKKLAKYYFDNLNSDFVPSWDLRFTDVGEHVDSSAAAIAICAVLEIFEKKSNDADIIHYRELAIKSLVSLVTNYSNVFENYIDSFITDGADNLPEGRYDESLIYGDYFYLEALIRAIGEFDTFWQ